MLDFVGQAHRRYRIDRKLKALLRIQTFESERPIKVVYRLRHPMPAEMFEMDRRGG